MSATIENRKTGSILGWLTCIIGGLSIIAVLFEAVAFSGGGITPGSVPVTFISGTASLGALLVGVPLGGVACHFGRKGLGAVGIALCVLPIVARFVTLNVIRW